jgi:cytosine/adenosine deaminase-related metal-dependent hydrolase
MTYSTYTHKYIVKNSQKLIKHGLIELKQGSDNIHSLGETKQIQGQIPDTILVPGFINLHCHLAYHSVNVESQPLFTWLKELYKKTFKDDRYSPRSNVLDSLDELLKFGTTYFVDNCFDIKTSHEAITEKGLKATLGLELFGSDPNEAEKIFQEGLELLNNFTNKDIDICFSPHAVYDVSKELWQKSVEWSKDNNKILLSHIAETQDEELFMQDIDHPQLSSAKEFWQSINSLKAKEENWQAYKSSVNFLKENNLLFEKLILAHAVYCSNADLQDLASASVKLINCPRSNSYLKNNRAQTEAWLKHGIEYAMGTDSKVSNQDLDIRKEVMKNTHLSSKEKFDKLTIDAARILGRDQDIGSLEQGKAADFVVLEALENDVQINENNIFDFIVDPDKTRVKKVFVNGVEKASF